MKKICFLTMITVLISFASTAQTVKDKIEKLSQDPRTAENAAKADAYVLQKKSIGDSTLDPNKEKQVTKKRLGSRRAGSCRQKETIRGVRF